MFENIRKRSEGVMLVVMVVGLATAFGVLYGPAGQGCSKGNIRISNIANVHGHVITEQDFQSMARIMRLGDNNTALVRQAIVDGLVERELLAHEAERLGFQISEDEVDQEIQDGYFYRSVGIAQQAQLPSYYRVARQAIDYSGNEAAPTTGRPTFKYEDFERWVNNAFVRTVRDYKQMMRREMLAERMRQFAIASVRVSDDELWRTWEHVHNLVSVRYLRFNPDFYRHVARDDDPAQVDAYAQAHQEEVNRTYQQRRESLTGLQAQVRVRTIMLRDDDLTMDNPTDADRERVRNTTQRRAEWLRDRMAAPNADPVRLARLYSQDDDAWRNGGESSWLAVTSLPFPDPVKNEIRGMEINQVRLVRSENTVYIVQLLNKREATFAEDQAKREIARELFRLSKAQELVQQAAEEAQRLLSAPGANMDTIGQQINQRALEAFFHGPVPAPETIAEGITLTPVTRSDINAPEVAETPQLAPGDDVPNISDSHAITQAAFALTNENPSPSAPISVGEDRFIIRLKERTTASREEFDRERLRLLDQARERRGREVLRVYINYLREVAKRSGGLRMGTSTLLRSGSSTPRSQTE